MDIGTIYLKLSESTGDIIYISTPEQFNDIRKNLDAHYVLLNDIDLADFYFLGANWNIYQSIHRYIRWQWIQYNRFYNFRFLNWLRFK